MHSVVLIDKASGLLGLAALAALALCWLARKHMQHGVELSLMLCGMWTYSKVVAYLWGWETARLMFPVGDVGALCVASFIWYLRPTQWKLGIVYAYLTKLFVHAIFWRNGIATTHDARELHNYSLALNILYFLAILCLLVAGVWTIGTLVGARLAPHWSWGRGLHIARGRPASRQAPKG